MRRDGTQAAVWADTWATARARSRARGAQGDAVSAWHALWVSRLIVWAAGVAAAALWGLSARVGAFDPGAVTRPFGPVGDALVAPLARWDSVWYLAIANDGYPPDDVRRTAFFPLYPLLVRAAGWVVGSPIVAGALVSLACFALALVLLHRLTELELGGPAAGPTVWALALFPGALFFSAVYSEALYLALSVGCLYAARTDRWAWAGAAGMLAASTRSAGVLLVVPLALLWWAGPARARTRAAPGRCGLDRAGARRPGRLLGLARARRRRPAGPDARAGGLVPSLRRAVRRRVGRRRRRVATGRTISRDPAARSDLVLFACLLVALPAVVGVLRRLPVAYGAYVVCALALPLSYPVDPQPLMSLPRFLAVLFPLFMWVGLWLAEGGRVRGVVVLGTSAVGLAVATAVFATWHWVA